MEALSCHHNNLFENCQCSEPGFCPIFSRTMGVDPPDWNWCQKTKSTEREKYYTLLSKAPPPEKKGLIEALNKYKGKNKKYFYIEYLTQHNKYHQCSLADKNQCLANEKIFQYIEDQKRTTFNTKNIQILCLGHNIKQFQSIEDRSYLTKINLNEINAGKYSDNKWAESRIFMSEDNLFTSNTDFIGVVSASWNQKYECYSRIDNFHNWNNAKILLNSDIADSIVLTADIFCTCDWTTKENNGHNILSLFFKGNESDIGKKILSLLNLDYHKHIKVPYGNQMIMHKNLYYQYVDYLKNNEVFEKVEYFLKNLAHKYYYKETDFIKENYHYNRTHAYLLEMVSCFWFANQSFMYLPNTERKEDWYNQNAVASRIKEWDSKERFGLWQ